MLRLRELRKSRRITLTQLGKAVNKSAATICKYERGEVPMTVETLLDICCYFGVPITEVVSTPHAPCGARKEEQHG